MSHLLGELHIRRSLAPSALHSSFPQALPGQVAEAEGCLPHLPAGIHVIASSNTLQAFWKGKVYDMLDCQGLNCEIGYTVASGEM